ncbi:MAG: POTRA domain-containing protein, partial [Bdellovibrionales bacterium]
MRYLLFICTFAFFFSINVLAAYRIQLEGLNEKQINTLSKLYPNYEQRRFSYRQLDQLISDLYLSGEFAKVSIEKREDSSLWIVGDSIKRVNEIIVEGADNISERQIINAAGIKQGAVLDRQRVLSSANKIKELYKNNGYFSAKIEAQIQIIDNTEADIQFTVEEGPVAKIVSITIDTENLHLKKTLENLLKPSLNEPVNESELRSIEEELTEYLTDNRYFKSRVVPQTIQYSDQQTEAYLRYRIKEADRYEVVLTGFDQIPRVELYRKLNLDELDRSTSDPVALIQEKLRQIYLDQGFAHVKIEPVPKKSKDPYLKYVNFKISEGPKVRIRNLNVTGRISRKPSYYEDFIEDNSATIIANGYYNRQAIENGYSNLLTELNNQGYLSPSIVSVKSTPNKDKTFMDIDITLDEGPLSIFQKITFIGNTIFNDEQLMEVISLRRGQPLNATRLQESITNIKNFYFDQGYLEMSLSTEDDQILNYDSDKKQAEVIFNITEGPKIFVKGIIIEGNTFTKDYVILNSIPFKEGDLLTPELLEEANTRLTRLRLFNRVSIEMLEKNSKISNRNIVVSVSESLPGTFKMGMGITDEYEFTARVYLGLNYTNLYGTARAINGRVDINNHVNLLGTPTYKTTLGYLEPFILDNLTSGTVSFTSVQTIDQFPEGNSEIATIKESNRIDLALQRDIAKFTKLTWTVWSLDRIRTFRINVDDNLESIDDVVIIGPAIEYDDRDNPFSPTKGFYARLSYDYSSPDLGSSETVKFYRVTGGMTHYTNLDKGRGIIWANNIQGGYVENLSDLSNSGVPEDYSFRLGGRSTIRGFDAGDDRESIVPLYEYNPNPPDDTGNPYVTTQSHYYLFKSEFRIPIYGSFGAVLFYDAGAVFIDEIDPKYAAPVDQKKPFRQSAGLGIRYNTPFGPINLEYAYK